MDYGNVQFYSIINENTNTTYRSCIHNQYSLPSEERLLQHIYKYPIAFDEVRHMFNKFSEKHNNYTYHILIECFKPYFNCRKIVNCIVRSFIVQQNMIKITNWESKTYCLTSDMKINIFIIRKIKMINCLYYDECIFTRLFARYEHSRTVFNKLQQQQYIVHIEKITDIPIPELKEIEDYPSIGLNSFVKCINLNLSTKNKIYKQIVIITWDGDISSIIVKRIKKWRDTNILGRRINRHGIKLYNINKDSDQIIYPDDKYIQYVSVVRKVIIKNKLNTAPDNDTNWRVKK